MPARQKCTHRDAQSVCRCASCCGFWPPDTALTSVRKTYSSSPPAGEVMTWEPNNLRHSSSCPCLLPACLLQCVLNGRHAEVGQPAWLDKFAIFQITSIFLSLIFENFFIWHLLSLTTPLITELIHVCLTSFCYRYHWESGLWSI